MHTGVDFGVPAGVEILASNDGTVIYVAYEAGGAGNTVTVEGADGWQSRYHHLERWTVEQGQAVRVGDVVGLCDSTGASTGPHLHFEIRQDAATPVDPLPILEADAIGDDFMAALNDDQQRELYENVRAMASTGIPALGLKNLFDYASMMASSGVELFELPNLFHGQQLIRDQLDAINDRLDALDASR